MRAFPTTTISSVISVSPLFSNAWRVYVVPGAFAWELSKQRNAALSAARAAKYPHPGILSLRYLPSHCDERLAHEHDIGRRA